MPDQLTKLLASLRRSCKSGLWSSGVNLVRAGAVAVESRNDEEIVLRVRSPGRAVAPTVVLYPGENEWDCDCPGRVRPCEHLAAAAIALGQGDAATGGDAETRPLPKSEEAWARIAYRFAQVPGGLHLRRFVVRSDGSETPLAGTLSALLSRPEQARSLQVEQYDLQADRILESGSRATLSPPKLDALVRTLVGARLVFLDGREVAMSEEELLPSALVEDGGDEVVVTIRRDPRITSVPSAGLVLAGEALTRHGEIELCGAWLQNLPIVQRYPGGQLAELATRVLPDLSRRMAVEVRSKRLPKIVRGLVPRLVLDTESIGIVAGGAAQAGLRQPALRAHRRRSHGSPIRPGAGARRAGQRRLVEKLRADLDLDAGSPLDLRGRGHCALRGQGQALARRSGRRRSAPDRCAGPPRARYARARPTWVGQRHPAGWLRFHLHRGGRDRGRAARARAGPHSVDAATVIRAWEDGLGLVPLGGGGFAPCRKLGLTSTAQSWPAARRPRQRRPPRQPRPARAGRLLRRSRPAAAGRLDRLAPLAEASSACPRPSCPRICAPACVPYQKIAVNWLAFLRSVGLGGILADDMGLGKTIEAMCLFEKRCLVVAPTSVLPNWQAELARFRPSLRVSVYHGRPQAGRSCRRHPHHLRNLAPRQRRAVCPPFRFWPTLPPEPEAPQHKVCSCGIEECGKSHTLAARRRLLSPLRGRRHENRVRPLPESRGTHIPTTGKLGSRVKLPRDPDVETARTRIFMLPASGAAIVCADCVMTTCTVWPSAIRPRRTEQVL